MLNQALVRKDGFFTNCDVCFRLRGSSKYLRGFCFHVMSRPRERCFFAMNNGLELKLFRKNQKRGCSFYAI